MAALKERLEHALTHPLDGWADSVEPYRSVDELPDGRLLVIVLAVDR